jgi:hypothetical protein
MNDPGGARAGRRRQFVTSSRDAAGEQHVQENCCRSAIANFRVGTPLAVPEFEAVAPADRFRTREGESQ